MTVRARACPHPPKTPSHGHTSAPTDNWESTTTGSTDTVSMAALRSSGGPPHESAKTLGGPLHLQDPRTLQRHPPTTQPTGAPSSPPMTSYSPAMLISGGVQLLGRLPGNPQFREKTQRQSDVRVRKPRSLPAPAS